MKKFLLISLFWIILGLLAVGFIYYKQNERMKEFEKKLATKLENYENIHANLLMDLGKALGHLSAELYAKGDLEKLRYVYNDFVRNNKYLKLIALLDPQGVVIVSTDVSLENDTLQVSNTLEPTLDKEGNLWTFSMPLIVHNQKVAIFLMEYKKEVTR